MVIKIKQLTMLNFKGVLGERKINFSPTLTEVYGANKTGKTTIADAFRWCLFGENSEGKTNFNVRTLDAHNQPIPDLPHEVEVVLEVDGREVTLKHCLLEKWVKERCKEEKTLSLPHAYYVDGKKYTETDYKAYVDNLCKRSLFLCLTNPSYFPTQLTADQQRVQLSKMVAVPSMEEVAQGNEGFVALLEEMADTSLADYLKHVGYQIAQIKEELKGLPLRIEEQSNELVKLQEGDTDWERIEGDIKATEAAVERIDEQLEDSSKIVDAEAAMLNGKRTQINQLKAKVLELRQAHQTAYRNEAYAASAAVDKAKAKVASIQRNIGAQQEAYSFASSQLKGIEAATEDFRTRWAETDAEEFAIDESRLVCPTCHRELEESDKAQQIAEMEAAFNTANAKSMERLEEEAAQIKARKQKYTEQMEAASLKVEELKKQLTAAQLELDKAQAVTTTSAEERIAADGEIARLTKEVQERTEELTKPSTNIEVQGSQSKVASLKEDKAQLLKKRDSLRDSLNVRTTIESKHKRIAQLQEQERTLNAQLSVLEGKEDTAKAFQLANIEALEERVNKLFTMVTFTMFERRLNGTTSPICECCIGGVPYKDLNAADRVNAGIDIINAIARYTDTYVPCFVDNVEGINNPLPMESQCIHLIVSRDKQLNVVANTNN